MLSHPSKPKELNRHVALALSFIATVAAGSAHGEEATVATELPEVQVVSQHESKEGTAESGYRNTASRTGFLGKVSLQDTPYSVNVTSGELFENRSAHTVSEALKANPTVSTLMESSGYTTMSRVMIRGFTAADQNDVRDGLVDRSFEFVPLENVDRIEVLNGLSGFLYGFSAPGGSLNYVSKQPTPEPYVSVAGGQYGGGINYLHGDIGGPAGTDKRWGYRVNLYDETGGSYIHGNKQDRQFVSAALTFNITDGTKVWADAWHQKVDMRGLVTYMNVFTSGSGNNKVYSTPEASRFDARTQYGQDWTYNKAEKTLIGAGIESELNDTFTFRAAYRNGDMWRDYQFVGGTLTSASGSAYTEKVTGSTRQTEQTQSMYALLDASFQTGSVGHKLTFGFTGTDFDYTRGEDVSAILGASDVADPVAYGNPGLTIGPTTTWSTTRASNWVIGDQVRFSEEWLGLVGLNRASLTQKRWGSATALSNQDFAQHKTTPSVALMFKPTPTLTLYSSYMEALANGGMAPSTAVNANQVLPPSVSDQVEVGAKANVVGVDMTMALFRINKINEYTDPTDNVYKQDGREVHQGIEFTAGGKPIDSLTVVGGFTIQDAHIAQAKNNSALEGKTPSNVPERQARLYMEYAMTGMPGLIVTGGANYFGRRPLDSLNTAYFSGATTYDLGLRYLTQVAGHKLTLIGNISNLFDKAYWSYYRSGDGLLLGAPRVVSLTAKMDL